MYQNIREEELKNKIAHDYFPNFDTTKIIGNVDFCVAISQAKEFEIQSLLWAEAKKGISNIFHSITQLILTIGKARTFDKSLPPAYLGAFDAEKIAFIPYNDIQEIFYLNDFNWNVTPSNYETREFKMVLERVQSIIESHSLQFFFENDQSELREFIKMNFVLGKSETSKIQIDKNNFMIIYNKWLQNVKPTITTNWEIAKKHGIIDGDFYLADLLSLENESLKEKLFVLLRKDHYQLDRKINEMGFFNSSTTSFTDKQRAHQLFWNKYQRPPKEEYWDYIVNRRDLLVPQDVRERKGSFYTPQIWVELSQKYLADVLGKDWQDEYYIWDCAAGTGNLLAGLTNKFHIWASTLDRQDVDVMQDRIKNGANLSADQVFQFDFLNDSFDKLPESLRTVINDPNKRKKLVIYINPPYAEASSRSTVVGKGENKSEVATKTKVYTDFQAKFGTAVRELYAQFFIRIYAEIPEAKLAQFSTLKAIQAINFLKFRNFFKAEFRKGFIVPAHTFDNVNGKFPIGFLIWNLENKQHIKGVECDIFNANNEFVGKKQFHAYDQGKFVIDWLRQFYDKKSERIAYLRMIGTDMQHNQGIFFTNSPSKNDVLKHLTSDITRNNLLQMSIYLVIRQVFESNWINNRDQFLFPNKKWEKDKEFQHNCLAFALFHGQNKISSKKAINHWIPFTEYEVDSRGKFDSNFMSNFIKGKNKPEENLFKKKKNSSPQPLEFSEEAKAVFDSGLAVWKYYHESIKNIPAWKGITPNVNASLYDIREYFQGRNEKGRMNSNSTDEKYTELMAILRKSLQILANKIEPKIYEYGFLKE